MSKKIFLSRRFCLFQFLLLSIFLMAGCTDDQENEAPVATKSHINVTEDEPKTALMQAEDKNGDQLKFSIKESPNKGELTILNQVTGQFEYTPDENFNGADQFIFRVSDGESEANATITIIVNAVNDAPEAVDDSYTLDEGSTKGANLLDNDSDSDANDSLTFNTTAIQPPSHGDVVLQEGGHFTYTHDDSETTSDSFKYEVTDSSGLAAQATVFLTINPVMNDSPVALDEEYTMNEGAVISASLLGSASDPDVGDSISFNTTAVKEPLNGTLQLQANGGFTYTHDGSETTNDSFQYEITDTTGRTAKATVTLIINQMNDAPVADDDASSTNKGIAVDIDVLDGDSDSDGTINTSSISIVNQPSGGVATVVNGKVRYAPGSSSLGEYFFDYTVEDNSGAVSNIAGVTIFVSHNNPVAEANCSFTAKQVQKVGALEASDSDSVDASAMVFKLGANGEITTNQWLDTDYGRVRITNETTGAFEYDHTNNSGLGKKDEFDFQVSVEGETPDSATQSFLIEPRIMPMGDSITDGITSGGAGSPEAADPAEDVRVGYRKELYQGLKGDGYIVNLVGSRNSGYNTPNFDENNEGHPGFTALEISNDVEGWLNQNPADIILLHIGTNNFFSSQTAAEAAAEVAATNTSVLARINSWAGDNNTNVTVLLAKIIGVHNDDGNGLTNTKVTSFNNSVMSRVASNESQWNNLNIEIIDQNSALSFEGDWAVQQGSGSGDKRFHPSASGYTKMANRWMEKLTSVLEDLCPTR